MAPPAPVSSAPSATSTLPSESDVTPAESGSAAPASVATEIGDIEWTFSPPLTMYTLRAAAPAQTVSH